MKYLGVIPARGGSKRLHKKNIREIYGKPLLAWSILAAQHSELLDDFIVSTDDEEIAEVSKQYGATVLMRPDELATDQATSVSVYKHALNTIPADYVVQLQPTSPIRIHNLIDRCIRKFEKVPYDIESLATGFICKEYEWGTMENMPSQDMVGWFYNDGNVEIHHRSINCNDLTYGSARLNYIIDEYYNHEIDSIYDFVQVEALMRYLDGEHGSLL